MQLLKKFIPETTYDVRFTMEEMDTLGEACFLYHKVKSTERQHESTSRRCNLALDLCNKIERILNGEL